MLRELWRRRFLWLWCGVGFLFVGLGFGMIFGSLHFLFSNFEDHPRAVFGFVLGWLVRDGIRSLARGIETCAEGARRARQEVSRG